MTKKKIQIQQFLTQFGTIIALVAVFIVFTSFVSGFIQVKNLLNISSADSTSRDNF
jgi:ribose/xylose/arabinose/galactoside ABC-type transport system permease subunit